MQTNANLQSVNRNSDESSFIDRIRAAFVFAWEVVVEAQGARAKVFSHFKYPG
jgi:hypothetical protein